MKRQIIIDSDARKRLQEAFGVTRVTVWKALNYESDNELARKIRYTAKKEMGGVEINGPLPGFDTTPPNGRRNYDTNIRPSCENHIAHEYQPAGGIGGRRGSPD